MKDKKKSGSGGGKKDDTSPKFQVRRICIFKPLPQASDTVRDMRKGKHLQVEIVDLLYSYPFLLLWRVWVGWHASGRWAGTLHFGSGDGRDETAIHAKAVQGGVFGNFGALLRKKCQGDQGGWTEG